MFTRATNRTSDEQTYGSYAFTAGVTCRGASRSIVAYAVEREKYAYRISAGERKKIEMLHRSTRCQPREEGNIYIPMIYLTRLHRVSWTSRMMWGFARSDVAAIFAVTSLLTVLSPLFVANSVDKIKTVYSRYSTFNFRDIFISRSKCLCLRERSVKTDHLSIRGEYIIFADNFERDRSARSGALFLKLTHFILLSRGGIFVPRV